MSKKIDFIEWAKANGYGKTEVPMNLMYMILDFQNYVESEVKNLHIQNVNHSALLKDLEVTNALYEERQKLLDAIPECEAHGKCVPHALEWIDKMKDLHCG